MKKKEERSVKLCVIFLLSQGEKSDGGKYTVAGYVLYCIVLCVG